MADPQPAPPTAAPHLYVGISGHVVAIDSVLGTEVWRRKVPGGSGLVCTLAAGEWVFASSAGQVHALLRATGDVIWTNELKGLGYQSATLSMEGISGDPAFPAMVAAALAASRAATSG